MKVDIPDFEGKLHPDEFIDRLNTVERVFYLKHMSDNTKVKVVAIKLKKHASIWWEHVKKQRVREGKSKIRSQEKMQKLLSRKFLPEHYRQEPFIEYHNLKQGDMSVEEFISELEEFISEFDRLRMRCDVAEEDEQTVAHFLGGLRIDISEVVQLQQYWTYEDVYKLALKVEQQLKRKNVVNRWQGRDFASN